MIGALGRIAAVGFILGGAWALSGSGCVREVDDHCANLSGDASCRGYSDGWEVRREFCNACEGTFHGCAETPPQEEGCWKKGDDPSDPPVDDTGTAATDTGDATASGSGGDDLPVVTGDGSGDGSGSGSGSDGPPAECGNGVIEEGEDCEGEDLGGADCSMFGSESGTLACNADCLFDPRLCDGFECGDGIIQQPPEECEEGMLNGQSCATLEDERTGGNLTCANCLFNTTACCIPNGDMCSDHADCCSGNCQKVLMAILGTCQPA